ncbi:MAG: DNA primase [Methylococcus sp.]
MAGKIPEPFIQELLARTDVVELIGARVPLKRSGANFMGRCPFHDEKTPSFSVNREKQFYYCFGCGAHGTAIGFLMEYDRLSFPEAIETLADTLGLPVPREQGSPRSDNSTSMQALYEIQEQACRFYQKQLKSHPLASRAIDYLRQRGVSGAAALRFRLGYAPQDYRNLPPEWSPEILKAAGLLSTRDAGGTHDWFRDRIIFPIRDRRGRVVGFGGRVLGEGVPKYLNSPETEVFHKHREVYGLYELLETVRKPEFIIVVEGYLDVIALAQQGLCNAVATLGTATSTEQVALLFRYSSTLVFCFDGDTAGRNAAWKALEASLPHLRDGRQLRFLVLPEGEDPDSLVRNEGVETFRQRIERARPFSDYFFDSLASSLNLGTIEGCAALFSKAQPLIERLPAGVFREMIEQRLGDLTHHQVTPAMGPVSSATAARGGAKGQPSAMRTFLALLLQNPALVDHIDSRSAERLGRIQGQGDLIRSLLDYLQQHPRITPAGVLEGFRDRPEGKVIGKLMVWNTQIAQERVLETFLDHLRHLTEDRLRENRLEILIEKARSQPLAADELEELRRLTLQSG